MSTVLRSQCTSGVTGMVAAASLGRSYVVCILTFASTFVLNRYIGRDWMPQDDQNELSVMAETARRLLPRGDGEGQPWRWRAKIEKVPGVIAAVPQSSTNCMTRASIWGSSTILLEGRRASAATSTRWLPRSEVLLRDYAYTRPRISFPNALGGRDTFAPIRGMLLGPDLKKLAAIGQGSQRRDDEDAVRGRRQGRHQPEQSRDAGDRSTARAHPTWACASPTSPARSGC